MSGPPLRVAVTGASGRMGRFACALLEREPGFEVAARIGRGDDLARALRASGAALGLDLTVAGLGFAHGLAMLDAGVRPVVGTSGVSEEETAELDRRARELALGGLVVPNFSLGIVLLQRAAVLAAPHLPAVEIVEVHHDAKRDSPSGTALDTAERIAAARGEAPPDSGDAPARGHVHRGVPIHALRLPGALAHHEVVLAGPGERLTLRHDTSGPEAFAPGILAALRHAARATGVARGLAAALEREPGAAEPTARGARRS